MTAAQKTPRGPADPGRRDRIIAAAVTVVAERGIIALTHRTVAKAAGVPLGSTTYYFDSLEDLLAAMLAKINDDYERTLHAWAEPLTDVGARRLAEALTDLVFAYLGDRSRARAEYEVCLAALDRPALRPLAAEYTATTIDVLHTLAPYSTAVALGAAVDGFVIRGLMSPAPLDRAELEAAFAVICGAHLERS